MTFDSFSQYYFRKDVIDHYASDEIIRPCERRVFELCREDIQGKRVLELGVGGGRLSGILGDMAAEFVGIDYVPAMVEICRNRFPHLAFLEGDARDLSRFDDGSFDYIIFGFNGIDTLGHEDRLIIMGEIHRVLRPGGIFCFSSQNRDYGKRVRVLDFRRGMGMNFFLVNARNVLSFLFALPHEVETDHYRIMSAPAGGLKNLGICTYCISKNDQITQLAELGFECLEAICHDGKLLPYEAIDRDSELIYYRAQKPQIAIGSAAGQLTIKRGADLKRETSH
ncbi:MAG: class I SAM-dependent methyltransferase [Pseudomonadota bacterium]